MTTMAAPRQPFGVLTSPRLAHLSASKNRLNGMVSSPGPLSGKAKMAVSMSSPSQKTSMKRRMAPSDFDDNEDSENVAPEVSASPPKRSKTDSSLLALKPKAPSMSSPSPYNFTFGAKTSASIASSMPPPSTIPARLTTPLKPSGIKKSSSPRTPLTAPAGRSPKSKRDRRRFSAHTPIIRVDPPAFSRSSERTALPFSLDAALKGSLAPPAPTMAPPPKPTASLEESMPQSWFFSIHEDTAQEEAENLMEHSTLTLDLSSDDESSLKANEDRGKENMAPADYIPSPSNSSSPSSRRSRKSKSAADMDTGPDSRSPLGHLDTTEFIPEGLAKDSIVYIPVTDDEDTLSGVPTVPEEDDHIAPITICEDADVGVLDVVSQEGDLKGEILIWEDDSASPAVSSPAPSSGGKRKRSTDDDDEC